MGRKDNKAKTAPRASAASDITEPPYPEKIPGAERWERNFRNGWVLRFRGHVHRNPTARNAWRDIERHGISDAAECALSMYMLQSADLIPRALPKNVRRMAGRVDIVSRAFRVAEERKDDPREEMFARRASVEASKLASEPWVDPDPSSPVKTFADALATMPELAALPIDRAPGTMRTAAEAVRRESGKPFLLILRDYAQKHGLKLGWARIAALAVCANEGKANEVDLERSLRRWASERNVIESRPAFLLGFEKIFPPKAR